MMLNVDNYKTLLAQYEKYDANFYNCLFSSIIFQRQHFSTRRKWWTKHWHIVVVTDIYVSIAFIFWLLLLLWLFYIFISIACFVFVSSLTENLFKKVLYVCINIYEAAFIYAHKYANMYMRYTYKYIYQFVQDVNSMKKKCKNFNTVHWWYTQ